MDGALISVVAQAMPSSNLSSAADSALWKTLFAPESIALIGASDDAAKTSSRPLQYLRQAGYKGTIFPINPRKQNVLGERCWATIADLPAPPEHAFILTQADDAVVAAAECARAGVRAATILATGFSEGGVAGGTRVAALRSICEKTGLRILGPSSLGIINLHRGSLITANAAFAEPGLRAGKTFVASHSGSMLGGLLSRGLARGAAFAGFVSVGNEIDLSLGEICLATLNDPNIEGYLLFLEHLHHSDALRTFALAASRAGRPVVAYKLGRSSEAAELALSHTGALAGTDDVAEAFFSDCGITRITNLDAFLDTLPLHKSIPAAATKRIPRIGVVTTTGGGAAMAVDELAMKSAAIAKPSADTYARLRELGVRAAEERIVDLTMAGTQYAVMKAAIDVMRSAPEFDLVLIVVGSSARFHPDLAVKPIIDSFLGDRGSPLAAFIVPDAPNAQAMLTAAGVPTFATPESCADSIVSTFNRRLPAARSPHRVAGNTGHQLDEVASYGVFKEAGIPHVETTVLDFIDAETPLPPFQYPVAIKVLSHELAHKSDIGGVRINVKDESSLRQDIRAMRETLAVARPDLALRHVIVQPMVSGVAEFLLGYRLDPDVGPLVMLAAGGIYAELYIDKSIRLAPVSLADAREMISEVRLSKMLTGFRNKARGDIDKLAEAIVSMSRLALRTGSPIVDAEINPLIVREQGNGVVAVDAVVRVER